MWGQRQRGWGGGRWGRGQANSHLSLGVGVLWGGGKNQGVGKNLWQVGGGGGGRQLTGGEGGTGKEPVEGGRW